MNTLMKGNSPLGMIYNQSAENIAYDSNNSVKDIINGSVTVADTAGKSSAVVFNSTEVQVLQSTGKLDLKAGNYVAICAINATWSVSSYQTKFCVRNVGNTTFTDGYSNASPQTNIPCFIVCPFSVSADGEYYMEIVGKTSNSAKEVTVPAYQNPRILVLRSM